jgi:mRNA-degrading endonuclease RelE of RelBE toxin-antitoxin system
MRRARETPPVTAYVVDISPPAWNQLATLSADDYGRIRSRLDAIASGLTPAQPPSSTQEAQAFVVEGYAVLYAVNAEHRRVTLLEVTRRIPQEE